MVAGFDIRCEAQVTELLALIDQPALMKPKATRFDDCIYCKHRDLDDDGVPDGCRAPGKCTKEDRRDPWSDR